MTSVHDYVDADPGPEEESAVQVLRVLDVEMMLATLPPPVPWVVEPILARGCVTIPAGREGRGKSMLALALAAGIGNATEILDIAGMSVGFSATCCTSTRRTGRTRHTAAFTGCT